MEESKKRKQCFEMYLQQTNGDETLKANIRFDFGVNDKDAKKVFLNDEFFLDHNFRKELASILRIKDGDEITEEMIQRTNMLFVSHSRISNLKGIEHFTELRVLYCHDNQLTSLDVSKNTKLELLSCFRNRLTSLDVSRCTAMKELYCHNNQLTSLDVSKNTALTKLLCHNNQLTSLDVSKNTAMGWLNCYNNRLTSLDVSRCTAMKILICFGNQIKGDKMWAIVASMPTVKKGRFYVINTKDGNEGNVCTKAQVAVTKEKGWTVYDYNGGVYNENHEYPEYEGGDDATAKLLLNAENFPDANFRAALAEILGIREGHEIIDAMISATTKLDVSQKSIADLTGIEYFTALEELDCYYNQLTSLDLSKNTALKELDCTNNQLTSLDVSRCAALTYLNCHDNRLTSLDVTQNTALEQLGCSSNKMTSIDVSQNTAMTMLDCDDNKLTSLDVTQNTKIEVLRCSINQLTALDVSKNTAMTWLYCYGNQLTSLDVSRCTALEKLNCDENQLTYFRCLKPITKIVF